MIPLQTPTHVQSYWNWLDSKQHGEMDYMNKSRETRSNPQTHFSPFQSVIVFTHPYFPSPETKSFPLQSLKIAHYARMKDYHLWFRAKLQGIIDELKKNVPDEEFRAFTDAVPLLERDLGAQAALGWIGKNTCLIHPEKGSLFFIGEILTTMKCEENLPPLHDFCGSCTACIEACPTQALNQNRQLNANLCISHWNIESRNTPPENLREKIGDWFFGCDICQTVCPWNIKLFKNHPDFQSQGISKNSPIEDLRYILKSSNKKLLKDFKDTPLSRAGGRGLKRNALIIIGNKALKELTPEVKQYQNHPHLAELAQWTLKKLS